MNDRQHNEHDDIYSQMLKAGKRTYFFDVRATKAGDYYLTVTESKKFINDDGSFQFKKHKIFLYKEDFKDFKEQLDAAFDFIIKNKGEVVISERHQDNYVRPQRNENSENNSKEKDSYTDVNFDDI